MNNQPFITLLKSVNPFFINISMEHIWSRKLEMSSKTSNKNEIPNPGISFFKSFISFLLEGYYYL
tara:strand:+ start:185 stop:379 length:195 start_codon:yes stop_codon:yes gene_type:complete